MGVAEEKRGHDVLMRTTLALSTPEEFLRGSTEFTGSGSHRGKCWLFLNARLMATVAPIMLTATAITK